MSRKVVSTSSSGLDYLNIKHDIELIRLRIHINNVEFVDGKNINVESLQKMMVETARTPIRTSPAPRSEVEELFAKLVQKGYKEVFVTTVSSRLSESYHIISKVAESYKSQLNIYIYDTKEINACEGLLALEANHLMKQGESMPNIARRLDALRKSHEMQFAVEDLSYLIKNKKLSATAGFFANLLSIKPVLRMTEEGEMVPLNKIRKIDKAIDSVLEQMASRFTGSDSFAYVLSTGRGDLDEIFIERLKNRTGIADINVFPASAIALANLGPTGVGMCVFTGERPHMAEYFESQLT